MTDWLASVPFTEKKKKKSFSLNLKLSGSPCDLTDNYCHLTCRLLKILKEGNPRELVGNTLNGFLG